MFLEKKINLHPLGDTRERRPGDMVRQAELPVTLKKTTSQITPRAGLSLIEKVSREVGMEQLLNLHFGSLKKREKGLSVARQILDMASMLIDGGTRIEDMKQLSSDLAWRALREQTQTMAPRTALDLLHRFSARDLARFETLEHQLSHRLSARLKDESRVITLDVDATFIQADKQEARVSYHKEPGYYPMLGFWAERATLVHGEFREGNESPASKALEFLKGCLKALPKARQIRLRSDAAWYQAEVMDFCDDHGVEFGIGAARHEALMGAVDAIKPQDWELWSQDAEELKERPEWVDWKIAETVHSVAGSSRSYRVLVIRKPYPQLDMFKGIVFEYDLVITNMDWEKRRLLRWYWERCNSENWIKELKYGFGLNQFPCSKSLPNGAYFHIVCLAYNLVQALKLLKLDPGWLYLTVKTLRYRLFHVAGLLVDHARKLYLKLFHQYPYYDLFHKILHQTSS
jgi:hypothetical protein